MPPTKRQRWTPGSVVEIDAGDGLLTYALLLREPLVEFRRLTAPAPATLERFLEAPVVFRIWVATRAVTGGDWRKVFKVPDFVHPPIPDFCKQDAVNGSCAAYHPDSTETPCTPEHCLTLEFAAVWSPEQAVERFRDEVAGRPNVWVQAMRSHFLRRLHRLD